MMFSTFISTARSQNIILILLTSGPFSSDVAGGEFVRLSREGLRNLCELQLEIPKAVLSEGSWGPWESFRGMDSGIISAAPEFLLRRALQAERTEGRRLHSRE